MRTNSILKRLSLFAVAGLFVLTSCDKENNGPEMESVNESNAILVADASASSDAVFIVNAVPEGCEKDTVTAASLPASVNTYLETNYSGYTYLKTFKVNKSLSVDGYIVVINYNNKPVGLYFNADGNFVKVFEQRERGQFRGKGWKQGGRFDGRDGKHRDTIAITALPVAVKTYFILNQPQDTLLAAHVAKGGDIVVISTNNGLYATLFNSAGVFIKRSQLILHAGRKTAITQAQLAANIVSYISTTYPGYVFHRAYAVKLNSTTQAYVVFIDSNDTKYALHFDASGNLVKSIAIK